MAWQFIFSKRRKVALLKSKANFFFAAYALLGMCLWVTSCRPDRIFTQPRELPPRKYIVPFQYSGQIYTIYDQVDYPKLPVDKEGWVIYLFPSDGILVTSSSNPVFQKGSYRWVQEWYQLTPEGKLQEIPPSFLSGGGGSGEFSVPLQRWLGSSTHFENASERCLYENDTIENKAVLNPDDPVYIEQEEQKLKNSRERLKQRCEYLFKHRTSK